MAVIYFEVSDDLKTEWQTALKRAAENEGRFVSQGDVLMPAMRKFIERHRAQNNKR